MSLDPPIGGGDAVMESVDRVSGRRRRFGVRACASTRGLRVVVFVSARGGRARPRRSGVAGQLCAAATRRGTATRHRQDRYRPRWASDDELFKAFGHLAIAAPGPTCCGQSGEVGQDPKERGRQTVAGRKPAP
jgi:hypothetical protein